MPSEIPPTFALALKFFRTRSGLTQDVLAERSRVSVRGISDLERGISRSPRKETIQLLAESMNLSSTETEQLIVLATPSAPRHVSESAAISNEPPLVGRADDVRQILRALADPAVRSLTLTGVAGIGKTRLALECAARLREADRSAVTVVDLAPVANPQYVLATIAQSLSLREHPTRSLAQVIAESLAVRSLVMVLDNCEHVLEARHDIAALLDACPTLKILATSRERLGIPGEVVQPLSALALPMGVTLQDDVALTENPAVMLFVACARGVQPDFAPPPANIRTIAKICLVLEGIPLAIELAATRVPVLSLRTMLTQLSGSQGGGILGWLRTPRSKTLARQQTLREALAWSYRLLDVREQIVLRRLSAFAAGWTAEAAAAICDPHDTLGIDVTLATLMEKSLVLSDMTASGSERYRMHFMVRAFGVEMLEARKERFTVQRAIAEWYATLTEQLEDALTGANQSESLRQLIQEYGNIRSVLQWAREQEAVTIGLRIAGSLWWFWENRGYLTEGREWLEGLLTRWESQLARVDDITAARVLYGATVLAITQGDFTKAEVYGTATLLRAVHPPLRARVLLTLGNLAKRTGKSASALEYYAQGLVVLRDLHDTKGLLVALNNMSTLHIEQGDLARGMKLLEESLELKRSIGDRRGIAVGLMNLGEIFKMQALFAQARSTTLEGLAIFTDLGDIQGMAFANSNLGEIAEDAGDTHAAAEAYTQSLAYARRLEDRAAMAQAARRLGLVRVRQHDLLAATETLREAASLYQDLEDAAGYDACAAMLAELLVSQEPFGI